MPTISGIEIFKADIPFRFAFIHSRKARSASESIFVKVTLDNGIAGYGESMPRHYVTGQTQDGVFSRLAEYAPRLIGAALGDQDTSLAFIKGMEGIEGDGRCALEIALLDAAGKTFGKPLGALLGTPAHTTFAYSGIVYGNSTLGVLASTLMMKREGFRFLKIKVGLANDAARVGACRAVYRDADLRIDANGAWDATTALEAIGRLRRWRISAVEQPTPKGDTSGLKAVSDACPEPVIADESLCTIADAVHLIKNRACDIFNVRLSKCGGIFRSLEIIKTAADAGLGFQIGCHVGESGILSAAARQMAGILEGTKYFEGSYGRIILTEDPICEDITPYKGTAPALSGPGLGVEVREAVLRTYSKDIRKVT